MFQGNPIRDYGMISFASSKKSKANFVRVSSGINVHKMQKYIVKHWKLCEPGIVVQVTGSAQGFDLPAKLIKPITEGIVEVAGTAKAWVITGGLDAGVMSLVGTALARWRHKCENVPVIGIASWRAVTEKERLENACGNKVQYWASKPNDKETASLEPNHTGFLLVDNPTTKSNFGGELTMLHALLAELKLDYGAPTVLVVIQGGKGTLQTVMGALRSGIVCVLAADSGQCAGAIAHFVKTGEAMEGWQDQRASFDELKQINLAAATKDELKGTFNDEWPLLNLFYLRGRDNISEVILNAVMKQSPIALQLKFAVAWDRKDMLEELLGSIGAYHSKRIDLMRDTLQHALELERPEMVKICFHYGAPTKEINILKLHKMLLDPERCRYSLFEKPVQEVRSGELAKSVRKPQQPYSPGSLSKCSPEKTAEAQSRSTASTIPPRVRVPDDEPSHQPRFGREVIANRRASFVAGTTKRAKNESLVNELTMGDIYPPEVIDFLIRVTPGLISYWERKIESKNYKRRYEVKRGMPIEEAEKEIRLGIRALDLYIWAVLLGNTELATALAQASEEPVRGALLGACICKRMAEMLPIESKALEEAAVVHEHFAIDIIELCSTYQEASTILLCPNKHWNRTVLQLAVFNGMKHFVAHRHCQNLTTRANFGDVELEGVAESDRCYAMLPAHFVREPSRWHTLVIVLQAICPPAPLIELVRAPRCPPERRLAWFDFYKIPHVKKLLRTACYHLYAALFAVVVVGQKWEGVAGWSFLGLEPTYLLAIWTISLVLDEWAQWVVNPSTFELELWNRYDYTNLSITVIGLFLRLGPMEPNQIADVIEGIFAVGHSAAMSVAGVAVEAGIVSGSVDEAAAAMRALRSHGGSSSYTPGDEDPPDQLTQRELDGHWLDLRGLDHGMLAAVNVMVWIRVLQHYSSLRGVGVLIIMIIEMLSDMQLWMVLSSIFLIAFAITFAAIAEDADEPYEALVSPVWGMLGELNIERVDQTSGKLGLSVLWVYALISNVLLVNLLIAMMGDTYGRVKEAADVEWKFGRVSAVLEFIERAYAVPPPFSLPLLAYRFVWWATCEFYNRIICCGESSALGKCGPYGNHSGNKYALVDADGDGNMDEENLEWNVGGRLWLLKRERQRVSTLALQNYKKAADEKEDSSSDGRLRRIETLVEELLIFSEENEREVLRVAQGLEQVRSSGGAGSARKRTSKGSELPA
ncbi:transient receptor potential cation channel subfamily m member 2 [Chrysochromulina tobinii]|uniref:Transient receptor potential cation channel subfamily m member 2 n=1 Tax=Chrysochromulina tobinii TaxID=1460289 RepID=A0A0M0JYM7_9EUKA|nr:transient receptor potential cation channel subfamily m member 2 [Chrysochromulina tobinii]|eukprot:KOO31412.1 transient receptor potential cation channel subfamily m member 2 [Chrysochromulina sp. CCMP291]